jgi:transcriptional regulator with XRE-family HTH domain
MEHLLTTYRKENHLTMEELAQRVGKTVKTVWCWENDVHKPSPELAIQLENITGGQVPFRYWYSKDQKQADA